MTRPKADACERLLRVNSGLGSQIRRIRLHLLGFGQIRNGRSCSSRLGQLLNELRWPVSLGRESLQFSTAAI